MIALWAMEDVGWPERLLGTVAALAVITFGYLHPVRRYLKRSGLADEGALRGTVGRMLLGACLGGVPLLATWASIQWASVWADQLAGGQSSAKSYTQFWSAGGAVLGAMLGAMLDRWLSRRVAYSLLCLSALAACQWFFLGNDHFGTMFLVS